MDRDKELRDTSGNMRKKNIIAVIEMLLVISLSITAANGFREFTSEGDYVPPVAGLYEKTITSLMGGNLVSAAGWQDLIGTAFSSFASESTSVCLEAKDGAICQTIETQDCDEYCTPGSCRTVSSGIGGSLPTPDECKIGTCQDPDNGVCAFNAPKKACEDDGGNWFDDPNGNVAECKQGCCIVGTGVSFTTEKQCQINAVAKGFDYGEEDAYFDPALNAETACLLSAVGDVEGACVFDREDEKNDCRRMTQSECARQDGLFEEGKLCSNEGLNTVCVAQNKTSCVEGLDEVYWFDSCGNKENIFGSSVSGKEGMILTKAESCTIGRSGDWLQNQASCGNCNRLASSMCGQETSGQELNDNPDGNVVCLDLGCEVDGQRRENGESWCNYQSNFGVSPADIPWSGTVSWLGGSGLSLGGFSGGFLGTRSVGPPGSGFYRESCVDGEVVVDQCSPYRNEICEEDLGTDGEGEPFSTASCRVNRWQECVNYNPPDRGEGVGGTAKVLAAMAQCESDPDCFVKTVQVGDDFKFPVCLPKYPPGFNLETGEQSGGEICSFASQTCPAIFVKKAKALGFGGTYWSCEANCECIEGDSPDNAQPSLKFVQEMNDLCTSLGDCGLKVNYVGDTGSIGSLKFTKCVTSDLEGECKNDRPTISTSMLINSVLTPVKQASDITAPAGKYIKSDPAALKRSIGASTAGPMGLLKQLTSYFGLDAESSSGGGEPISGGVPDVELYEGDELPWVGGISGASGVGTALLIHKGWLPATTAVGQAGAGGAASAAAAVPSSASATLFINTKPLPSDLFSVYTTKDVFLPTGEVFTTPGGYATVDPLFPDKFIPGGAVYARIEDVPPGITTKLTSIGWDPVSQKVVPIGDVGAEVVYPPAAPEGTASTISGTNVFNPTTAAFGNALAGAGIAGAVTSLLIYFSGISPGIGEGGVWGLTAGGFGSGALIGAGLPNTIGAGSGIPGGTALSSGTFTTGASSVELTAGSATYTLGGNTITATAGGATPAIIPANTVATVAQGGATLGTEGAGVVASAGNTVGTGAATGTATTAATPLLAVGIVIAVVVLFTIILNWAQGVGEMKKVEISSECKPWTPPLGGAKCEECGADGFPCNAYACSALGGTCQLIGEEPNVACADVSPNDVSGPVVEPITGNVSEGYDIRSAGDDFEIVKENGECMEEFESATFSVSTDEYSQCKIGLSSAMSFEDMEFMNGENYYLREHSHEVSSLWILQYFDDIGEGFDDEEERTVTMTIICQDASGNPSETYSANVCVVRRDTMAPLLTSLTPNPFIVPYNTTEVRVRVRSNEPAVIRWSSEDEDFDDMENLFTCPISGGVTDCYVTVPLDSEETTMYIRGKDRPSWIGTDREDERHENQQSIIVTVQRAGSALSIDSVEPEGEINIGTTRASVRITAETSGGYDGNARCRFSLDGGNEIEFAQTGGREHEQVVERFRDGKHNVEVICEDVIGNVATAESEFTLVKDLSKPEIVRVYSESGNLLVITDEKATCSFMAQSAGLNERQCGFAVDEGTIMSATLEGKVHSTAFEEGQKYFIRCEDDFGNVAGGCSLIAAESDFV